MVLSGSRAITTQLVVSTMLVGVCFICMEYSRIHSSHSELLQVEMGRPTEQDMVLNNKKHPINEDVSKTGFTFSVRDLSHHSAQKKKPARKTQEVWSSDDGLYNSLMTGGAEEVKPSSKKMHEVVMSFKQIESAALKDLARLRNGDRAPTMSLHEQHTYSGLHKNGVNTGEDPWDAIYRDRDEEATKMHRHQHLPSSNGKLRGAGVNTGEEEAGVVGEDAHVTDEQRLPRGIWEEPSRLKSHTHPEEEAAEKVEEGKLESMGVNTGERHSQWNDALMTPEEEEVEGSYLLGSQKTPIVEKAAGGAALAGAHSFFQKTLTPLLSAQQVGQGKAKREEREAPAAVKAAASDLLKKVGEEEAEAREAAGEYGGKEREALKALHDAQVAKRMAEKVGRERLSAKAAQQQVEEEEAKLAAQLALARHTLPAARKAAPSKAAAAAPPSLPAPKEAKAKQAGGTTKGGRKQEGVKEGEAAALGLASQEFPASLASSSSLPSPRSASKPSPRAAAPAPTTEAAAKTKRLDKEVMRDRKENKALASPKDVTSFFQAVNKEGTKQEEGKKAKRAKKEGVEAQAATKTKKRGEAKGGKTARKAGKEGAGMATIERMLAEAEGHVTGARFKAAEQQSHVTSPEALVTSQDALVTKAATKAVGEKNEEMKPTDKEGLALRPSSMCSFSFWGIHPFCPYPASPAP